MISLKTIFMLENGCLDPAGGVGRPLALQNNRFWKKVNIEVKLRESGRIQIRLTPP
jgi:hypothetical protein